MIERKGARYRITEPRWEGGLSSAEGEEMRYDTPNTRGTVNSMKVNTNDFGRTPTATSGRYNASVERVPAPEFPGEDDDVEYRGEWLPRHDVYMNVRTPQRAKAVVENLTALSPEERSQRGLPLMYRNVGQHARRRQRGLPG